MIDIIDFEAGQSPTPTHLDRVVRVNSWGKIYKTRLLGAAQINRFAKIGPDVQLGKYVTVNEHTQISRATCGNFCSFGAFNAINPFNHPTNWLSTHEFQYPTRSFNWISEYQDIARAERSPAMDQHVLIGSDVWTGHNVTILSGVEIGHGAVIGAGAVVTKHIPPYAVAVGVPAKVKRFRFSKDIVGRLLATRWWDMELSQLSGLPFNDIDLCLVKLEILRWNES